jgi:hypothetical protein
MADAGGQARACPRLRRHGSRPSSFHLRACKRRRWPRGLEVPDLCCSRADEAAAVAHSRFWPIAEMSPESAAGCWSGPAATVASGPQGGNLCPGPLRSVAASTGTQAPREGRGSRRRRDGDGLRGGVSRDLGGHLPVEKVQDRVGRAQNSSGLSWNALRNSAYRSISTQRIHRPRVT